MTRLFPVFFLLGVLPFSLVACIKEQPSLRRNNATLDAVESYINERPDSALAVLRGLDIADKKTNRSTLARSSLLHSIALDKCYIDLQTDSILYPALVYYKKHGSVDDRIKTLYYWGRIQYNAKKYQEAIVTYSQALELTNQAHDKKYIGFVNQAIADTYAVTFQDAEALPYLTRAYDAFIQVPDSSLAKKTLYKKALACTAQRRWGEADSLYVFLLSNPAGIESLIPKIQSNYALHLVLRDPQNSKLASSLFREAIRTTGTLSTADLWAAFAYCLYREGQDAQSRSLFEQLENLYPNDKKVDLWRSRYEFETGNPVQAYHSLRSGMYFQDSLLRIQLENSTMLAQKKYYENRSLLEERAALKHKYTLWIVLSCFILLSFIGFLFARSRAQKLQIERLRLIHTIETINRQKENDNLLWQQQYKQLFQSYFNTLGKICADYEEGKINGTNASERAILCRLDRIIADFTGNADNHMAFEQLLNRHMNNIMSDFKRDFPKMQPQRYQLVAYLFAGIDMNTISALMGLDIEVLYARKHRIKRVISESSVKERGRYLEFFL